MITSYSQNFEDVLLWRALGDVKTGQYLDIGAQHPLLDSVSMLFYEHGWRGTHVEANAHYAGLLRDARPEERVIHAAVTDAQGPLPFFEIAETGLSTGREDIARHHDREGFAHRRVDVPTVRLDRLLSMLEGDIHWLKVDVEGMEGDVLRSWGNSKVRPWVLLIEATFPNSQEPTHPEWIHEVTRRGYEEVYFDGLSRYFVHSDHSELKQRFESPPNVFDEFQITVAHFAAHGLAAELADVHRRAGEYADGLREDGQRVREALEAEQAACAAARGQVEAFERVSTEAQARAEDLRQRLEDLKRVTTEDLERTIAETAAATEELRVLRERERENTTALERLRHEASSKDAELRRSEEREAEARDELGRSREEALARQEESRRRTEEVSSALAIANQQRLELERRLAEVGQFQQEASLREQKLRDEAVGLREKLHEAERAHAAESSRVELLDRALAEARDDKARERAEKVRLEAAVKETGKEAGQLGIELARITARLQQSQVRERELAREQGEAASRHDALRSAMSALVADLATAAEKLRFSDRLARVQRKYIARQQAMRHSEASQRRELQLSLERLELLNEDLSKSLSGARTEVTELAAERDDMARRLGEAAALLDSSHSEALAAFDRLGKIERARQLKSVWARLRRDDDHEAAQSVLDSARETLRQNLNIHHSSFDRENMMATRKNRSSAPDRLESRKSRAIFTIVSNNYLHFARTLLKSVASVHPEADLFCVIVDTDLSYAGELADEFKVIPMRELKLPAGDQFIFQYNVLELNTAVKPWSFEHLMDQGYEQILYIDPDIRLYEPLTDVVEALDSGNDIVVTPHLLAPIDDDLRPTELDIRRAGTYNFGFCAVRTTDNSRRFVRWWQSKLETECIIALDRGIFVDQSWMDLVPGMFDRTFVLRHPGYNVAYWNLAQREMKKVNGEWTVNGEPLIFFHYSGLNPLNPKPFSKHQNRFTLDNIGPVRELVDGYVEELTANGVKRYSKVPYGYGLFSDGEVIPGFFNTLYREDDRLKAALGPQPFASSGALLAPARVVDREEVSWAMLALWFFRVDLQAAFPLTDGQSVQNYRAWFAHEGSNYYSQKIVNHERDRVLASAAAAATSESAEADQENETASDSPSSGLSRADEAPRAPSQTRNDYDPVTGRIHSLFYTILGRFAEPQAVETYRRMIAKPSGNLRVWKSIANSRENLQREGWFGRSWRGLQVAYGKELPYSVSTIPGLVAPSPSRARPAEHDVAELTTVDQAADLQAQPAAEPRASVADQPQWHERRLAALRGQPAPFWLHLPDPDTKDVGYWTTSTVRLRMPVDAGGKKVRIEGWFPADYVNQQSGQTENRIGVFVQDRSVATEVLTATGTFEIEAELPKDVGSRPTLTILSEHYFEPSTIGLNEDSRELAMRLRRVTLGDAVLFDSGLDEPETLAGQDLYTPPGINLVGYVKAELGVGEAARSLAAAAREATIPYSVIDVGFQSFNRQNDESAMAAAVAERQPIDIVYVNADQTPITLSYLNKIGHKAPLRVGVWHWEQPSLPERYLTSFSGLDEIWAPTSFVQEAISALSPIPVAKIADAVHFELPKAPNRKRFGLPARQFLALVMYDFASYQYRKNPQAAVEAFRLAAKDRKNATLVIKTINAKNHEKEFTKLKKSVADLPNVVFLTEFLSRKEVYELQACCDVLLSLHRAEGFGLAPAEMMFLGKPVIATGWSGNMDFMTPMNSFPVNYELRPLKETQGVYEAGPVWAEADVEHAARCLKQVMDDRTLAREIGLRAAADIRTTHSPEAVGREMRKRLNLLADLHGIG